MKKMNCNLNQLNNENNNLKTDNKNIHNEFSKQQEKIQHQLMQTNQLNEKIQVNCLFNLINFFIHILKPLSFNKKKQKLEALNEKLEDERSQLFEQLHLLLQQNQEMLTQSLQNKDVYHEETKAYIQQLNSLKRQKEILEQKIMEQYKNCPSLSQKQK